MPSPYGGVSTQQLKDRQQEELAAQDAGLDSLHDAIVRQKRVAEAIGGEVGVQNEILEDIGDALDQGRGRGRSRGYHYNLVYCGLMATFSKFHI